MYVVAVRRLRYTCPRHFFLDQSLGVRAFVQRFEVIVLFGRGAVDMKGAIACFAVATLRFMEWGADWCKQAGLPIDSVIQMALQLAWGRMHGATAEQLRP